jgi:hypothetical protein
MSMAANRAGKSTVGCYETTVHLTGRYPAWWEGNASMMRSRVLSLAIQI